MDHWLPLMDYAIKRGVSLSTLRRYIKAKKISFKIEGGRYLIYDGDPRAEELTTQATHAPIGAQETAPAGDPLRHELRLAREEIAELKTLIALYEEQFTPGA